MHIFSFLEKLLNNSSEQVKQNVTYPKEENKKVQVDEVKKPNSSYPSFTPPKASFENKPKKEKELSSSLSCYALFPKDGDTFVGMYNNEKLTFRLAGINAPEFGKPWAKQATEFLREQIGKKVVYLEFLGKDPYDRHIVEVFLDKEKKQSVNKMLLEAGFATSERYKDNQGNPTHSLLEHLDNEFDEKIAQIKGEGMWAKDSESEMGAIRKNKP